MNKEILHLHKRKRIHQKLEKYPHKNKWVRFLDRFLLFLAIVGPLINAPQVFRIFDLKNAGGLSIVTWSLYAIFDIPWVIYGIVHKEKPIVIGYTLWFFTNILIIVGILMYG
ncbi:hypothetical protein K8R47_01705 [archaeon]|nr:hypothetical protein [archaeon]